jgi:hypothetical protein
MPRWEGRMVKNMQAFHLHPETHLRLLTPAITAPNRRTHSLS